MPARRSLFGGVDVGASATKVVLLGASEEVRGSAVLPSGVDYAATARECLGRALEQAGASREDLAFVVATGYGRDNVELADVALTEILCHGIGCYHHVPRAISVVDIGGQDNKVIRLDQEGRQQHFRMNRKCAAGTGAFLEEIAVRLSLSLEDLDRLARAADSTLELSSFCTVFAKTEILAHLRRGATPASIVRGAFAAVVTRVAEMDSLEGEVLLTGGVAAHNPTIAAMLAARIGHAVVVPPDPQLTGALGAALVARRRSASRPDRQAG
ncbi:MAG: acyl-CoA dehydratase activase [Pseudomonadota bacterium]